MAPRRIQQIAFFSHTAAVAGAERALLHAIRTALQSGIRARAYLPERGPLEAELASLRVPVDSFPISRHFDVLPHWMQPQRWQSLWTGFGDRVAQVSTKLEASGVDLVYVNTIYPIEAAFAAAHAGVPLLWHPHELYHERFHDWLLGMPMFHVLMGALADVVIAVSAPCLEAMQAFVPAEKLCLVHEPVDWNALQVPQAVPDDLRGERASAKHVLACVGSIDRRKAQFDLLQALALLPADLARSTLTWVVGTPSNPELHAEFQRDLSALPAHVRVRCLGQRPDVAAILQACDVLVHPSINDPFPLAVLEALACGKPVIAARGGGVVESVEEGVTGTLVPVSAPAELCAAIEALLGNPARKEAMGRAARDSVRKYDVAHYESRIAGALQQAGASAVDARARRRLAEEFEDHVARIAGSLAPDGHARPSVPPTLAHRVRKTLKGFARKVRKD
jgi:glycosyltransferase involved in cell wall biosynthesis